MPDGLVVDTAYVAIRPDGTTFTSDLQTQTAPGIDNLKKQLLTLGVGLGLAVGIKDSFDQLTQGQAVVAQTKQRLADLGDSATVSAAHVADLAHELQGVSGTNQNVIQSAENVVLTFHSIQNEGDGLNAVFDRTTKAALDLSAAGFGDVTNTAKQLGKALEDPSVGMTALRRVGVTFTTAQVDVIKSLQQTGDLLDAQKLILDQVESKVGGAAAAYGNTLGGQLDKAKASLLETGAAILQTLNPALTGLAKGAASAATAFEALPPAVIAGVVAFGVLKLAIDSTIGQALIASITAAASNFADFFALIGTEGAAAFEILDASALATAAAFAVPAAALAIVTSHVNDTKKAADGLRDSINQKIDTSSYDDYNRILGEINAQNAKNTAGANNVLGFTSDQVAAETKVLDAAGQKIENLASQSKALAVAAGISTQAASQWLAKEDSLGKTFDSNSAAIAGYTAHLKDNAQAVTDDQAAVVKANSDMTDATLTYRKSQLDLNDALAAQHALSLEDRQDALAVTSAQQALIDAQRTLNQAWAEGATLAENVVKAQLDQLSATLDLSDAQQQLAEDERGYQTTVTETSYAGAVHKSTAEQLARDNIAVQEAQLKVTDSTTGVTTAQQAQTNQAQDVAKAQLGVASASLQLQSAQQKVQGEAALVTKAQLAVDQAQQQVKKSADAQATASVAQIKAWNDLTGAVWIYAGSLLQLQAIQNNATTTKKLTQAGGVPIPAGKTQRDVLNQQGAFDVSHQPDISLSANPPAPITINNNISGFSPEEALGAVTRTSFFQISGLSGTS